jgi:hypothetical protein
MKATGYFDLPADNRQAPKNSPPKRSKASPVLTRASIEVGILCGFFSGSVSDVRVKNTMNNAAGMNPGRILFMVFLIGT